MAMRLKIKIQPETYFAQDSPASDKISLTTNRKTACHSMYQAARASLVVGSKPASLKRMRNLAGRRHMRD